MADRSRKMDAMSLLERFALATGAATRSSDPAPAPTITTSTSPTPAGNMPPSRGDLTAVTPREAAALEAVFRSYQILQAAALQLTVDVWRGAQRVPADRLPSVVRRPNVWTNQGEFWAETVASLAARGNAYWLKRRDPAGQLLHLEVLDPVTVWPYRNERGRIVYAHEGATLTDYEISHMRLVRMPGEVLGLGPIQAAQRGLRGQLDVAGYGSDFFRTGEVPSGVLTTDQNLTAAQAADYKNAWKTSRQAYDTAVLGNGLKYDHLKLSPSEVQWLESQRFNVAAVARLFGIPSRQLLVAIEGGSTTYANAEQEDIAFVRYTLMAYLRVIELAMSDLLPGVQTARFNVDALLRTDTKTRYEAHAIGLGAKFLTVEEVRAIEGLDPIVATPATVNTPQEVPA